MPENKNISWINGSVPESTSLPSEVAAIMKNTNYWADAALITSWASWEKDLFISTWRHTKDAMGYILGLKTANPADFSQIIDFKEALKKQEKTQTNPSHPEWTANDSNYKAAA